ncbi:MAG TPA: hypothetical protein PKW62_11330, partial [Chitinophagaceae bacterium]|nr:hypothetical protein [Chitinophagaceae bacterium]
FNIIDTNLFYSGTYKTASIALDTTNSLGRNSELVPIENCQPITIYKIVPCSGKTNSQISGCFQELLSVYCWVEYIETGIGSGGDGGATGGEGDGTPGECNSNPTEGNRTAINNTCGPGWEPVPIDDEPPAASTDPCDIAKDAAKKMDSIYIKANVAAMLDTMATLSHDSLETGFTIFKEFRVSPYTNPDGTKDTTFTGVYSQSDMNIGTTMGISYTYYLPRLFINTATVHFHTSNAFPAQSAHDIYLLIANLLDTHWYDGNFVIAANGSQYAITVSDSAKAIAFFSTKAAFLDTVTNEWKESSLIGKEFDKAKKYFENGDTSKTNYAYEMAMAAVLNSFNSGITLHKKDSNGNFKPILVKTVIPNPNKPKKKIYVQDCL